jgi:deoxyribonuclease (pyrimidine dimer)
MTRINSNIDPKLLKRRHLVAELREITMIPASLSRSLMTRSHLMVLSGIPKKFTLNTGHVKFFYNKLTFLQHRFDRLCDEMDRRGYVPDRRRRTAFDGFDERFYNDWTSTPEDDNIVHERIALRISQKPFLYLDIL